MIINIVIKVSKLCVNLFVFFSIIYIMKDNMVMEIIVGIKIFVILFIICCMGVLFFCVFCIIWMILVKSVLVFIFLV